MKVKIKIWEVYSATGERIGTYFNKAEADEVILWQTSGWGKVEEKIVEAIVA
jgi:hypothetical protein